MQVTHTLSLYCLRCAAVNIPHALPARHLSKLGTQGCDHLSTHGIQVTQEELTRIIHVCNWHTAIFASVYMCALIILLCLLPTAVKHLNTPDG